MKNNNFQKKDSSTDNVNNGFSAEEQQFSEKLFKLAEQIQPEQEFVIRLEAQITVASQKSNNQQQKVLHEKNYEGVKSHGFTFAAVGVAVMAIVVISFLTVPSLNAAAREALGFWIKTEDIQTIPTPYTLPTVDSQGIPAIVETIELAMEATQQATPKPTQVEYVIKLPTRLPEGYQINNLNLGQRGNAWVDLSNNAGSMLTLQIQPASEMEGTIIGPEDKVVEVQIGKLVGEYVRGGWAQNHSISGQIKPGQAEKLIWIDDTRFHKLRWNDGNLNYYLVFAGGRRPGEPDYLGMNDLATIAASMEPVSKNGGSRPKPKPFVPDNGAGEEYLGYIMDFQQLEALAGFDIPEPSVIPTSYEYIGGEITMVAPFANLQYTCDDPQYSYSSFGFTLEVSKMSEKELAWVMEKFGQEEIGESAQIESLTVQGVTAEYVKGSWNYGVEAQTNEKKWDNNIHYHVLKWYKEGFLYTVRTVGVIASNYQGACMLTKEDLVAFAASLK